jgi:PAS domain S-box-containing protein
VAEPGLNATREGTPPRLGIGAFRLVGGVVVFEVAEEILALNPDAGPALGRRLGFLVVPRTMRAAPNSDVVGRLVGAGATVAVGNRSGDVWTNLSAPIKAPPITPDRAGIAEYKAADGSWRVGGLSLIDGTPWTVWVEFPRETLTAAARAGFRQLMLLAAGLVVLAAFGVAILSARITKPLHELTEASEAIASGDYAWRFATSRRDEVGRLGAAFNAMAAQVEHARHDLEQRVRERTRSLEESSDLLRARIQELNDTREELSQFFGLSLDLLCIAGMDGRFKRVNGAWQRTLGWTAEELTGRPYLDFIHPDDRASTSAEAGRQAAGQAAISFENRYRCKDGSYRWLSWNAAPLPSRGLIFAAARDVTDEKRTAKELERRAEELTVVNHELEAFSYSVSHDLRAPLRHIHGYVEMLQRSTNGNLSEQAQRYLKTITDASVEMSQLIDDLLAFSRMSRTEMRTSPVPLDQLVKETIRNLEMATRDRRIIWEAAQLPPVVGDPSLLKQVLANVIGNALKYSRMRDPARIEIGCAGEEDGRLILFVRDNGAGFDMQYVNKLFGVFQRLHRPEEFEGTGIGLATVRRIVARHGGRVWAEGAVNEGATFYFTLKPALSA